MTKCQKCGTETGPAFSLCARCVRAEDAQLESSPMSLGAVLMSKHGIKVPERKMWMGSTPKECDLCHNPFGFKNTSTFIDGRTAFGPWAILCEACHRDQGLGLGLGKGQKYDLKTLEKIEG